MQASAACSAVSTPSPEATDGQALAPVPVGAVGADVRLHRLRAMHRDANALVAVRDRDPLGQGNRRVLGQRVGERTDLGQQTRRRGGAHDVPLAALDHRG